MLRNSLAKRSRFAPSPTGEMHVGHAAAALYVLAISHEQGAQVHLRIEDHDRIRCTDVFAAQILEDLKWLGMWESFVEAEDSSAVLYQSKRQHIYSARAQELAAQNLLYGCTCSRKEIAARLGEPVSGEELLYDGHCRDRGILPLQKGQATRVRLTNMQIGFQDLCLGPTIQTTARGQHDFVIQDRDQQWTYQFCVVIDDIEQDINLIVRGQDILPSTGRQLALWRYLVQAKAHAPVYAHHPLIYDPKTGKKLAKRDRSTSIRALREQGTRPTEVFGLTLAALGVLAKPEPLSREAAQQKLLSHLAG